jgi:hypothetical protein
MMVFDCLFHWNEAFIKPLTPKYPFLKIPVPFLRIPVPFLRIPVPFLRTPADSSGMPPFLQELVGHGEVLAQGNVLTISFPPRHIFLCLPRPMYFFAWLYFLMGMVHIWMGHCIQGPSQGIDCYFQKM